MTFRRLRPDRCVCRGDEGLHYPASVVTPNTTFCILSKTAHFILLECPYNFLVENFNKQTSCNYQAEKLADILTVKLISISLCGFYSLHWELARQRIICTPVTSTSSSACNLSLERRCRLCSPPGSLGDVWQCADRYDYP